MKPSFAAAAFLAAIIGSACSGDAAPPERVLLGTTHTLEDSGMLDTLVASFKAAHPELTLSTVVGSSGEVLTMAERGDFDVIFTHAPDDEAAFVNGGHGSDRKLVMHNDFVIAGPPDDSAGVSNATDAADALMRIRQAGAMFVSRGDDSGTHKKELQLWKAAGVEPVWDGYVEAGTGMADALRLASQRRAYILCDRATFTVLRDELDLAIVKDGDSRLLNQYSVTIVTSAANPEGARAFSDWITGVAAQAIIAEFGKAKTGTPLFIPDAR